MMISKTFAFYCLISIIITLSFSLLKAELSGDEQHYEAIVDEIIVSNESYYSVYSKLQNAIILARVYSANFLWPVILYVFHDIPLVLFFIRILLIFLVIRMSNTVFNLKGLSRFFVILLFGPLIFYSNTLLRDDVLISLFLLIFYRIIIQRKIFLTLILLCLLFFLRFYWGIYLLVILLFVRFQLKLHRILIPLSFLLLIWLSNLFGFGQYIAFSDLYKAPIKLLLSPIPWNIDWSTAGLYENPIIYTFHFLTKITIIFFILHIRVPLFSIFVSNHFRLLFLFGIFQAITILNGPRQLLVFQILLFLWLLSKSNPRTNVLE